MHDDSPRSSLQRRSFFTRFAGGLAAFGVGFGARAVSVAAAEDGHWQPERHPQDNWYEQLPGRHRFFFDTTTPDGIGQAIAFATNYFTANKTEYALESGDLAVVICLRHQSTPFAFTDAIWEKYGAPMGERMKFDDPKTGKAPTLNVYNATGYGTTLPNRGNTLDGLIKLGVHFAVCQMATRAYSTTIAEKTGSTVDDIYKELTANAIANSHFVPAGIVAVNRAQERGYSVVHAG